MSNCIPTITGQNVDVVHVWTYGGQYIPLGTKCSCGIETFTEETEKITIKFEDEENPNKET